MFVLTPLEDFESCFGKPADKKRKLYNGMIKCDLYQYFNTRLETFGIMELIPLQDTQSESLVEVVEIVDYSKEQPFTTIKKVGDETFSDIVHRLFTLRGSTLYTEDILANSNMEKLKQITIKTSKNTFYNLEIYSYTNSVAGEQFFVKTNFSEGNLATNYVLEISSWTKSRLDF